MDLDTFVVGHRCRSVGCVIVIVPSPTLLALHIHKRTRTRTHLHVQCAHHHHRRRTLLPSNGIHETGGYKNPSYMLPPSNQWSRFGARTQRHRRTHANCRACGARACVTDIQRLATKWACEREKARKMEKEHYDCCYFTFCIQQYHFY